MPVMTSRRKLVTTRKCRNRSNGTKRVNHSSSTWVLTLASRNFFESCKYSQMARTSHKRLCSPKKANVPSSKPVLVAFAATRVAESLEVVPLRFLNLVRRVTIRANRAALVAPGQQLAMHTLKVGFLDADMAFAAGFGDVGVVDGRVAVHPALDVMHAVAVIAGRRDNQPHLQERAAVDAFHVLRRGLRKLHLVFLRQPRVAVAPGAGLREVQLENWRRRVLHWQNAMRAMTIPAIGSARSPHPMAQAVDARGVIFRLLFMAAGAIRRRQFALMHQVLDAGVAIHTVEHGMNGFLKGVGRKKQRNDFPVHLAGGGGIQMAVETIGVLEFLRGIHGEQAQAKANQQQTPGPMQMTPLTSRNRHIFQTVGPC